MGHPDIDEAKTLAARHRKSGVLILSVGNNSFCVTSYGTTRIKCDALRKVADLLNDLIEHGTIDLSAFGFGMDEEP